MEQSYRIGARSVRALRGVSLEVATGSFVTIVGRSGSGKSTLLALLGGLARPGAGSVELDGADVLRLGAAARARRFGYMFQFAGLLPTLTALENALLPLRLAGLPDDGRARSWLTALGLGERLWALPSELSGGEQRRVAAVRAVIHEPLVVLADEPTADLDEVSERQVMDFLRAHSRTLVLVTHNAELARGADQLVRLEEGSLEHLTAPPPVELPELLVSVPAAAEAERPWARPPRRWVGALAVLLLVALCTDLGLTWKERRELRARTEARRALERAAMLRLRSEVAEIKRGAGGSYEVTVEVQSTEPVYLLTPEVSAYVQVGFNWVEVPLAGPPPGAVLEVKGKQAFRYVLKPAVPAFEQVLPGYMHVRFTDVMRVSLTRQPGPDGVVRRSDNYFVYLQPPGADPRELARRNNFPREAPLWIPMPPH